MSGPKFVLLIQIVKMTIENSHVMHHFKLEFDNITKIISFNL